MKHHSLRHEFVQYLPSALEEGVLYVSVPYATAAHKCCCGCGHEVVTPLSPTDWTLSFDGRTVSLDPSIGNWSFPCQSHYWITRNRVDWARQWTQKQIAANRANDSHAKEKHYQTMKTPTPDEKNAGDAKPENKSEKGSFWRRLKSRF